MLVAALSAASLLAVVADTRPPGTQFWPVGEAVVNIAVARPRLTHEPIELPPDHPGQLSLDLDP